MKKTLFLLLITLQTFAQNVIPAPVSFERTNDFFMLDQQTSIDAGDNADAKRMAQTFADFLAISGMKLSMKAVPTPSQSNKVIAFEINKTPNPTIGNEGYMLEVNTTNVKLAANTAAGLFNGIQTLRQLLPKEMENKEMMMPMGMLQGCKITDYPRFGWRGLMFDVSRNFFTKAEVKRYLDDMARYKLNVFHWHLTDDEGWRVEIKSLPKLTEIGAFRVKRQGMWGEREAPKEGEAATDGGFYTQDDIREIVKYAQERNISILPEIDVPGHSMAAIAAYPELSCSKDPKTRVNPGSTFAEWYGNGTFKMLIDNTLNPADPKVYEFLDKVMGELATLFPFPYIHVGGDECYKGYWEKDANCKALMKKEGLKNGEELQAYFMKKLEKIVQSKGKKMIGWDEILEGGLAPEATVMSWRGIKGGIEAAKQKHNVVMTPTTFAYLDYMQGDPTLEVPIYAKLYLKTCYNFEPVPDSVDTKYILGGQGNLWTEKIPTIRHAEYMTFPRAWALAEVYWTPKEKKNWDNFMGRVDDQFQRAEYIGMNASKAVYDAIITPKKEADNLTITLNCESPNSEIYYTINDTFPDKYTSKYTQPFVLPTGPITLKVITYKNGRPSGRVISVKRADLEKRAGK